MESGLLVSLAALVCALLFDRLCGEYPSCLHPVVWMGRLVSLLLKIAPQHGWRRQFVFGVFLASSVTAVSVAAAVSALSAASMNVWAEIAVGAFLLKASFALSELGAAAERVRIPVEVHDLAAAREALRSLCSRDPTHLDEEALLTATVQSLAENASDSFVAPLFYFALLGIPGAIGYRAINTLDAMVGYRGRFEALGKASARLDDIVNFLPARLTAALFWISGLLTGANAAQGWHVFRRDRAKTPSPNGGRPMAMMAGLLGVQLEKKGAYILGDPEKPVTPMTVRSAWRIVIFTGWLMSGLCAVAVAGMHFNDFWAYRF